MIPLSLFDEALTSADVEPVVMQPDWVIWSFAFSPHLAVSESADIFLSRWGYLFEE